MSKEDRSAALAERKFAVATIKNIRKVRKILSVYPFTAETFNAINGDDCGIEQLLGRDVVFESLNESEKLSLRSDINKKLRISEDAAFEALRDMTKKYFADVQRVIDGINPDMVNGNIVYLGSNNKLALETFNEFKLPAGSLECERCVSTLEHLKVIAEAIDESVPDIEHELDVSEAEYDEEQHSHDNDGDVPVEEIVDAPTGDDIDPSDNPEIQPVAPNAIPPEDQNGDEENMTDFTWVEAEEAFLDSATKFTTPIEESMNETGFDQRRSTNILKDYAEIMTKYRNSLQNLKNVVAPETCSAESLLRGSTDLYRRLDKIVTLVENIEPLCNCLNKSCENLMDLAKKMMIAATKNPML